ncbi:MAG: hypothetical protein GOVbin4162_109 [Prokaryotic dsDNA virus sp.]|nr:MAG: hypothetical protein GOVbin4162_109 [Prokaryotic dsDNA virus sp.]|tara:strand:- start:2619 stop:2939 length:321 start_codon:yes stop_codon:yes gene_type:complete
MNNLNISTGEVSFYGFMCGYLDRTENSDTDQSVEIYHDGLFHVRMFDNKAPNAGRGKGFNAGLDCGAFWLSFERLTDARKLYRKLRTCVKRNNDYTSILAFDNGEV